MVPGSMRVAVSILISLWLTLAFANADDNQWVVVSMRQYQIQGASRIHLYLYAMDGTFQRTLTDDQGVNDLDPVFSYDGKSVKFTREAVDKSKGKEAGDYVIDIASGTIRRYDQEKDWFPGTQCDLFSNAFAADSQGWINIDTGSYESLDGKFKLQRMPMTGQDGSPGPYQVLAQGKSATPLAGLPGFISTDDTSPWDNPQVCNASPFVTDGSGMELVFFLHHLNSTDGSQIWGLDLTTMQGAKISQNGAEIYHPPSASGVFVVSQARYQPLGNTGKTVNCSYLEWWDAHLKQVRYGPDLSVCISAAIYGGQSGKNAVIPGGY